MITLCRARAIANPIFPPPRNPLDIISPAFDIIDRFFDEIENQVDIIDADLT
jgi:hypothetical protein